MKRKSNEQQKNMHAQSHINVYAQKQS